MLNLSMIWNRFVPRSPTPPRPTIVPPLRKAPTKATPQARAETLKAPTPKLSVKAAPLVLPKAVRPDTYPVYVEVARPSGRGHHVVGVELHLDVDILNAIYEAALDATDSEVGPIHTIVVRIAVPQTGEVTILTPADSQRRPEDEGQMALFDLSGNDDDADKDELDHECQFDEDGVCWLCGESAEDDDEVDPIDYLTERLKERGRGSQKASQRVKLAEAIFDHFLAFFDWQADDVEGMWAQFDAVYGHLYDRLMLSSFDPQDIGVRLELIDDMLDRAESGGIDPDDSEDVWTHFVTHYQVSFSLVNGKRKPMVHPAKVKVAS